MEQDWSVSNPCLISMEAFGNYAHFDSSYNVIRYLQPMFKNVICVSAKMKKWHKISYTQWPHNIFIYPAINIALHRINFLLKFFFLFHCLWGKTVWLTLQATLTITVTITSISNAITVWISLVWIRCTGTIVFDIINI